MNNAFELFLMILVPRRASESISFIDFYKDLSESL